MAAQVLAYLLILLFSHFAYALMLGQMGRLEHSCTAARSVIVCELANDTTALSFPHNYTQICRLRLERIYLGSPMSDLDLE